MQDVLDSWMYMMQSSPAAFITIVFLFSLLVGSFLNVVIHRLPIMVERDWKAQAKEILGCDSQTCPKCEAAPADTYNLVVPRSACPNCKAPITALQNVPVISYLLLRGKCAKCSAKISIRYPLVELLTGILSAAVAWKFGVSWYTFAALLLTWVLIALSVIDFDTQYLHDDLTLPLMWLGLIASLGAHIPSLQFPVDPVASILGAAGGYLSLWTVAVLFQWIAKKEGMGPGDFKLLAALGAWLGWKMLPVIILLSAFVGSIVGISMILFLGRDKDIPIPFGPYLAAAGWIALMWGTPIVESYFRMSGLR